MDPRINMVMVSAKDINALRGFYEHGLGWMPWMPPSEGSVAYKVGTAVLIFVNAAYLEHESGIAANGAPKSIWAVFVPTKEDVDAAFELAAKAGARITSPVRDRDQGLYSGYFADPEGNAWEVVWSPHMPLGADGSLTLPGAA
ncbi:VOC family protein [Novosphingobium sp. KCTC 2891]|uniref:VOC family protein n=1 Tax=Novosphingobium sp. KCTC 2891 TaxID=2989730 RepID=UPI002223A093|nr:VOC family protein [Novosphingobium sp. KCTC 2891]MCW1385072.1 VOC family protein [Novosphingobium sp. KCTC 2891]